MAERRRFHREIRLLRTVWHAARGQHLKMTVALLLELVIGLFPPAAIYLLQDILGAKAGNIASILTQENLIWVLAIYFAYILLTKLTRVLMAYSVAEVEYGLRMQFSRALLRIPFERVAASLGIQASNGLTQEIALTANLVPTLYRSFIRGGVTIIAFCVLLIVLSPRFFLIVLALTSALIVSIVTLRKRLKRINAEMFDRISSLHGYFAEWIRGYRVYRSYGCMDFALRRMQGAFRKIRDLSRRLTVVANSQAAFAEMLTYGIAAVIILMMPNVDGVVDISMVVSYPVAIMYIRGELLQVINGYQQLATTESSVRRLFDIIHTPGHDITTMPDMTDVCEIRFEGVGYAYPRPEGKDGKQESVPAPAAAGILRDASMRLRRGGMNVIVGPSGAGKTTTLNLLLGLLQPRRGEISIIRDAAGEGSRSGIGLVEQEPFLFDGTLADNLCMGRPGISDREMLRYLDRFNLLRVFPDAASLHTERRKFDSLLSSGEKQRLSLIRALLGNPALLIADEPTSNIDAETSRMITEYLRELSKEVLVVAVSHDRDLIEGADAVIDITAINNHEISTDNN